MKKPKLLMAMRGDYINEPSKGALHFSREIALYLSEYMEIYLIGKQKGEKVGWEEKKIDGKIFPFFDPYRKLRFPIMRPFDSFFALKLSLEEIRQVEPDIVYLHEIDFLPLTKLSKPMVLHIHGCFKEMLALRYPPLIKCWRYIHSPFMNSLRGHFNLWLLKKHISLLDKIFVSAQKAQIRYFNEKKPVIGAKLVYFPLTIDTERFRPMERNKAREILGLPRDAFIVLFIGGLDPLKSPQILLQAFAKMKKQLPQSILIYIGKGTLEEFLKRKVRILDLEKDVLFMGRVPNEKLPLYYNSADVFALPSLYEGVSMVTLEALACGTPIIITPIVVTSEYIENGVQGFVVRENDEEALCEALLKAGELPSWVRERCREVALQFSPSLVGELIRRELLSLLNE
ncbi:glycosyltransferase family 4 protein [bacterium]|nr:glycosyltransferase family 4 protein [bacterium]